LSAAKPTALLVRYSFTTKTRRTRKKRRPTLRVSVVKLLGRELMGFASLNPSYPLAGRRPARTPRSKMRRSRAGFAWQTRANVDRKLDLLAQAAEDRHQPIDRETGEIYVADAHEFAVRNPGARLGLPG
jgi:hypothetical protein